MDYNPANETADFAQQASELVIADIRHLSTTELQQLGAGHIAYVKAVKVNGDAAFAIHAADGTPMALAPNEELAVAAILQHEMAAALVH